MNIFQLLGGRILWAGDGDSLQGLVLSLMPEMLEVTMKQAQAERDLYHGRRAQRSKLIGEQREKVTAALAAGGVTLKVDNSTDDGDGEDEDAEKAYFSSAPLTKLDNGVGMITVNGPLVNSDKWYLKYLGQVGYPHIQDSLVRAYNDPEVTSLLMNYTTPGGAVSGIGETVDAIRAVNQMMPVSSFATGQMLSGGYWLGTAAGPIMSAPLTQHGSIGVIMTHMEYSKMLDNAGITATVLREGKYKALMTPYEPLSDAAKAQAQDDMKVIYGAFTQSVATGRGVPLDVADKQMGQGRVFWTDDALAKGMTDRVGTLSDAVAKSADLADTRARQASGVSRFTF